MSFNDARPRGSAERKRGRMTFEQFVKGVHVHLAGDAEAKGYNRGGPDAENDLYRFIQQTVSGDGHPIGEIIYKARRYAAKRDPRDLLKAAAWGFLILKHREEDDHE